MTHALTPAQVRSRQRRLHELWNVLDRYDWHPQPGDRKFQCDCGAWLYSSCDAEGMVSEETCDQCALMEARQIRDELGCSCADSDERCARCDPEYVPDDDPDFDEYGDRRAEWNEDRK